MSYAGPAGSRGPRRAAIRPPAPGIDHETDWQHVAIFGAGLAAGLALGAGIALLSAPQAGWKTRAEIRRFGRNKRRALQLRSREAWHDLRDELHDAADWWRGWRTNGHSRVHGGLHPDSDDR
jgi:hypothetical protein